jgi:hypothetical protein
MAFDKVQHEVFRKNAVVILFYDNEFLSFAGI